MTKNELITLINSTIDGTISLSALAEKVSEHNSTIHAKVESTGDKSILKYIVSLGYDFKKVDNKTMKAFGFTLKAIAVNAWEITVSGIAKRYFVGKLIGQKDDTCTYINLGSKGDDRLDEDHIEFMKSVNEAADKYALAMNVTDRKYSGLKYDYCKSILKHCATSMKNLGGLTFSECDDFKKALDKKNPIAF